MEYPNAGPNANLGLYRTGEVPQAGDRVRHNSVVLAYPYEGPDGTEPDEGVVVNVFQMVATDCRLVTFRQECECGDYVAPRFDLVER